MGCSTAVPADSAATWTDASWWTFTTSPPSGPITLQQPVGSVLLGEDSLLDTRRQVAGVGQDPDLDEAHRLRLEAFSSEWSAPEPSVMRWTDPAGSGPNGPPTLSWWPNVPSTT